jgi:hypothetical protein
MKSSKKELRMKTLARDYLTQISLNGELKAEKSSPLNKNFDKIIADELDFFSKFNKIRTRSSKQNKFFNYYKQKLSNENPCSNRLIYFLKSEFENYTNNTKGYIDQILKCNNPKKSNRLNKSNKIIVKINNHSEVSMSDAESDYFKSQNENRRKTYVINTNMPFNNNNNINNNINHLGTSNVTLSSSSSASIHLADSFKFSSSFPSRILNRLSKNELESINDNHSQQMFIGGTRKYQRTVSESSGESYSNYGTNKNINSISSSKTRLMHYKPILFNCLKRLTNEKILFSSNNSYVSLFSRLPFKTFAQK